MSDFATISRAAFLLDPAGALRKAEESGEPVLILDEEGKPHALISCPRDERPVST